MNSISTHILLAFALMLSVLCAHAHEQKDHLVIPVNPFAPWVIEEQGVISGIDIDIINLLAKELDFTYELVSCPFARCLKLLESGQADLMLGLFKRAEREAFISYVEPGYYKNDPKVFYVNKEAGVRIKQYEDLRKLRVGVVIGTGYFAPFDSDENFNKEFVSQDLQLLHMLKNKRIDTFVGTPSHVEYLITNKLESDPFLQAELILKKGELSYIGISKKSDVLKDKERFSSAVKKLIDKDLINRLVKSYLKQ